MGQFPKPFTRIPHYYAENVTMDLLCHLHDMFDIRWHELQLYVSKFIILESNITHLHRHSKASLL
ncbi:hypothetical protein Ahy_B01g055362 [Arachis hypogaea]|uniref:Uncharacterized protein n=1 Tax=Arachis hypogaea TaxID=3818 RepID=A0A445AVZ5_ARAHY|nr:hypothetical protein Ahy_B01g055362 [Arachis hypogaea]